MTNNKDVSKTRHQELSTRIIAEMMGSGPQQLFVITVVRGEASDKETWYELGWSLAGRLRYERGKDCAAYNLSRYTHVFLIGTRAVHGCSRSFAMHGEGP